MEPETKTQTSSREKGRARSRGKKKQVIPDCGTKMKKSITSNDEPSVVPEIITYLDADITKLEAPTFSTINKGPPEPMLRLNWDHKTHLIGEKVINPMIHCCDKCNAPILIYGRMIPCKHVFCLTCAENDNKVCPRCQEKIIRIEKTGVGTVFMCTFGGTRYGNTGCRRTYLSQRDLEAHINHRHVSGSIINKESLNSARSSSLLNPFSIAGSRMKLTVAYHMAAVNDPRVHTSSSSEYYHKIHQSSSSAPSSTSPPSLRHSHLQSYLPHQSEQSTNNQHSVTLQSKQIQRHLPVSTAQQLLQSTNFVKQMICSYSQSTSNSVTSTTNVRSNLITVPIQDPKGDRAKIVGTAAGFSTRTTNFSRNYSQQFSQVSFPVPSPGKPVINSAQTQYFSPTSLKTYLTTSPQRCVMSQFSPSTSTQPIINPSQLMPASISTPRKTQFPSDPIIPSFPVPPPPCHGWHQPSTGQTNFY